MMIYPIPEVFQVPDRLLYPEGNFPDFEYWFMKNVSESDFSIYDRVYLPILFTSYFKREQYGKNQAAINLLQRFVDSLPSDKKYFCIVQYDDGALIDWRGKDVKVFSMSGKGDIPLPLVCQPHPYRFNDVKKDINCSFVGRITHPVRKIITEWGHGKKGCYITSEHHSAHDYCKILARSRFVICARGYGASSFRVCESLQYGAMPIIFNDTEDKVYRCPISCVVDYDHFDRSLLDSVYEWVMEDRIPFDGLWTGYEQYYSFAGVKNIILDSLWNLD